MSTIPVIAIDGPSGSGKGAVAARLADRLGFHLLDSGALYRLTALAAARTGIDTDDPQAVAAVAADLDIRFDGAQVGEGVRVLLAGDDVSTEIRTESCGMLASKLASYGPVRAALLQRQRDFRRPPGLVADGRDMGSVVFTDASLKLFLTASADVRARRRYKQLIEKGLTANLQTLLADILDRDRRDAQRSESPLQIADDAIEIDTSDMPLDQVMQAVWGLVRARGLG